MADEKVVVDLLAFKQFCICGASQDGVMTRQSACKVAAVFAESHTGDGHGIYGTKREAKEAKRKAKRKA